MNKANRDQKKKPITPGYSNLLEQLKSAIESVTTKPAIRSGKGYRLQCPAHYGTKHSLFIGDGDQRLIISCHSHHCDPKAIMEAAGLSIGDVYYEKFNPERAAEYIDRVTTRKLLDELEHELIMISLWMTDTKEGVFPRVQDDVHKVKQAFHRVKKALTFLEASL